MIGLVLFVPGLLAGAMVLLIYRVLTVKISRLSRGLLFVALCNVLVLAGLVSAWSRGKYINSTDTLAFHTMYLPFLIYQVLNLRHIYRELKRKAGGLLFVVLCNLVVFVVSVVSFWRDSEFSPRAGVLLTAAYLPVVVFSIVTNIRFSRQMKGAINPR